MPRIPRSRQSAKRLLFSAFVLTGLAASLVLFIYSSSRRSTLAETTGLDSRLAAQPAGVASGFNVEELNSSPAGTSTADSTKAEISEAYGKLPLSFVANQGQTDDRVKFMSRGQGYGLFLTPDEAVLALRKSSTDGGEAVVRIKLLKANPEPQVEGQDELASKSNYFTGNDPAKWRTNVANYARVQYRDVYPGVDLVYYGNQRSLEYDFVVAPGADPKAIALTFQGARSIKVDQSGDLVLDTPGGTLRQRKPFIYQEVGGHRQEIAGSYLLRGKYQASFRVGDYDVSKPLIIDPVLDYSTYLGSNGSGDGGMDVAADANGNAYVTGYTNLDNFPTTAGAFQQTFKGGTDVFVTKFNPTGSALIYSTYLGGTFNDEGRGISLDAGGNAYLTGYTNSTDFPTTAGAFQTVFGGGPYQSGDGFVTKLNPSGSALVYSTYLGGTDSDLANSIAIDGAGSAYVTGKTSSTDFPTMTPLQATLRGVGDAFVTKLNPAGSALAYSTYLGGAVDSFPSGTTAPESGNGIILDAGGNAYVTGSAGSTDFPTTPGAFQTSIGGSEDYIGDAFVTKLNGTGTELVYSTYLGGLYTDQGNGIAIDAAGHAYVTGATQSSDFPTLNPIRATNDSAFDSDAFVTKLNPTGSGLVYSTYIGANSTDSGRGIVVDSMNRATIIGTTNSVFFPIVDPPVQERVGGSYDAFVTSLNETGSAIFYSSLIGGSGNEAGNGIGIDASDNVYLTGLTTSITTNAFLSPFPTANPFQATRRGQGDAFVSKIAVGATGFSISGHLTSGSQGGGQTVNLGGSRRGSTRTDSNGYYIFRNLAPGRSYTVTPVGDPFGSMIPQSRTFNNLSQDETADFVQAYKIIGNVTDRDQNRLAGVTITLSGSRSATTQTDSNGDYEFLDLPAQGSYTVTPSLSGYYFAPPKWTVDPLLNNQSLGFTASSLPVPWTYESDIGSVGAAGSATYDNGTFTINGSGADIGGIEDAFHYVHQRLTTTDGEIVARVGSIENTNPDARAGIMFRDDDVDGNARYVAMLVTPGGEVRFQRRTEKGGTTATTTSTGSAPVWLKLVRRDMNTYRGYKSADGVRWELIGSETITMSQYLFVGMVVSSHDNSALCAATFDNVAAKITITTPEEGAAFTPDASIPISATISGTANKVDFYANNTLIGTDNTSPYSITWDGVKPAGDYNLTARATEAHGTTPSSPVKIRIEGEVQPRSISGRVTSASGGLKGVTVALSGSVSKTTTSSADGSYSFTGLTPGGNYTVTPSRVNLTFAPLSRSFTGLDADKTNVNFTPAPVTIGGLVKVGRTALGSVRVVLSSPGLASRIATTSADGSYSFANLQAGRTYTVTPSKINYTFTPGSYTYSNLVVNRTANFTATLKTYTINGLVLRAGNTTGIGGVTMTITSPSPAGFAARKVQTSSTGNYTFTNLPAGRNYTVKPSKTGCGSFTPATRSFSNLSRDIPSGAATRFTGTCSP